MATFVAHGLLGSGVMAAPARALGLPKWVMNLVAIYGFILGSFPDAWDWIMATFFGAQRWVLYSIYHAHKLPHWDFSAPTYLLYQPPFFLHIFIDSWFHDPAKPGWNWWSELWWLEVLMWIVSGLFLFYTYREAIQKCLGQRESSTQEVKD